MTTAEFQEYKKSFSTENIAIKNTIADEKNKKRLAKKYTKRVAFEAIVVNSDETHYEMLQRHAK